MQPGTPKKTNRAGLPQTRPVKRGGVAKQNLRSVVQELAPAFDSVAQFHGDVESTSAKLAKRNWNDFVADDNAMTHADFKLPQAITYDGKAYVPDTIIGSGTFGTIVSYTHSRQDKLGAKILKAWKTNGKEAPCFDTKDLVGDYNPKNAHHKFILQQFCIDNDYNGSNVIIMELCDGNFNTLLAQELGPSKDGHAIHRAYGKWPQCLKIDLLIKIIGTIGYLWTLGYAYLDLKLDNVLYKKEHQSLELFEIVPKLADLDGICSRKPGDEIVMREATVTYPPPEYDGGCTKTALSWGIGLFIVMVLAKRSDLPKLRKMHHHSAVFSQGGEAVRANAKTTRDSINATLLPGLDDAQLGVVKGLLEVDVTRRTTIAALNKVLGEYRGWLDKQCPLQHQHMRPKVV